MASLTDRLIEIADRIAFIRAVLSGKLVLGTDRTEEEIYKDIERLDLLPRYYTELRPNQYTQAEIDNLIAYQARL